MSFFFTKIPYKHNAVILTLRKKKKRDNNTAMRIKKNGSWDQNELTRLEGKLNMRNMSVFVLQIQQRLMLPTRV